ncbi:MAG: protein kinase [Steroidobacteraceae bacterium]
MHGTPVADDPDDRTLDLPATATPAPTTVDMLPAERSDDGQSAPDPSGDIGIVVALPIRQDVNPAPPASQPETILSRPEEPQPALQAPQPTVVEIGTVLRERYQLTELIGAGGFSLIFGATDLHRQHDESSSSRVAIKVLKPELRASADAVGRMKREFARLQLLTHPAISRARDLDHDGDVWFLVLDRLDGEPLSTLLSRNLKRPMAREQALRIIRDSGAALDFAHQHQILHCDFKPGNILVAGEDEIRVIDFGAGFDQSSLSATEENSCADSRQATPAYASPERLAGASPDIRDDVFSFAAVAYELLSGKRLRGDDPASADRGSQAAPPRPPGLTELQWKRLTQAMFPLRDGRLASVRPLLDAFMPPATRGRQWPPVTLAASLAGALVLASITLYGTLSTRPGTTTQMSAGASNGSESPPQSNGLEPASTAPPAISSAAELLRTLPVDAARTLPATRPPTPEPGLSLVTLDQADLRVTRPTAMAAMIVQRTAGPERRVRVLWNTVPGTALPGIDYSPVEAGVVHLADNQDTSSLYVPLLKRDNVAIDRTFYIEITSDDPGVNVGPVGRVAVTIIGQEDAPAGIRREDSTE